MLADDAVDFLRLLAVGYLFIEVEDLDRPPMDDDDLRETRTPLRAWVTSTFGVTVPDTGAEAISSTALADEELADPWRALLSTLPS